MSLINHLKLLFNFTQESVSSKYQEEFLEFIANNNLIRMYRVTWLTFMFSLLLFIVDYFIINSYIGIQYPLYSKLLIIQHFSLLGFSLFNIIFYLRTRNLLNLYYKNIYQYVILQTFFFLLAFFSIVGQLYHGSVTLYLVGIFSVAAFFVFNLSTSLKLFLTTHIVFLSGVILIQTDSKILLNNTINGSVALFLAIILNRVLYHFKVKEFNSSKTIEEKNQELETSNNNLEVAKNKIEDLLSNILPKQIVAEFNEKGFSKPTNNENATIVFTDFVSFCSYAERTESKTVVENLDTVFQRFDDIVRNKGLEKLKTIGDSYMFAGGLFTNNNQLETALDAAFEILDLMKRKQGLFSENSNYHWDLRIGVHTGPIVTGLIGKWRFIYDTWGNTVNLASRLESSSYPNKINVSDIVFEQLKHNTKYKFYDRGIFPIKNLSPIRMYFVDKIL